MLSGNKIYINGPHLFRFYYTFGRKNIYSIDLKSCQILMYLCLEMSLAVNGTTSTAGYAMDQN